MRTRNLLVGLALAACSGPPVAGATTTIPATTTVAPTTAGTTTTTALAGAALDLAILQASLEGTHPEPYHGVDEQAFRSQLAALSATIDDMEPEVGMVELMLLWAQLSREGQDGHQIVLPQEGSEGPMLPLRVYEFTDGLYITDSIDEALTGARIESLAGIPIQEVLGALEPLVPRDSPATVPGFRPFYLLRADVLQGIGLITDDQMVELEISRPGGSEAISVETVPFAEFASWSGPLGVIHLPAQAGLRFTEERELFWTETIGDSLYVRLEQVQSVDTSDLEKLRASAAEPSVSKIIFDLRHNPGGNNFTYPRLLETLQELQQPLFVLTDRRTFSAASNLATEIEKSTEATFAGEEMGGGLNFWNDVNFTQLNHLAIPLRVGISTRYHEKSFPEDRRLTITPDLEIELTSADYFAGIDRVLEQALASPG